MMLCVDCGLEVPKTIKGSCPACFVDKTPLLSVADVVDVELCANCRARRIANRWADAPQGSDDQWLREDAVREACGVHERVQDPFFQLDETAQDDKHFQIQVLMEGTVEGVDVEDTASLTVRQRNGVCDRCSRMAGNFYAAIIQLRATERDVTERELKWAHRLVQEELERQQAAGNRFAFLTKGGAIHGGWDYYIGDIEAGRQVGRILKQRLGAAVSETAKLVGRKEGEDVYRVTFLVRINLYSQGDFAIWKGDTPVQVMSLSKGNVHCMDLGRHRKTRVAETSLKRIGGAEILEEAVLVSQGDHEVQVMDPISYQTQDVLRPDGWKPDGETVHVLRFDDRLHIVPNAGKS